MDVGLIGAGFIGKRFVDALIDAGHDVVVYDVDRTQSEAAVERGARAADGPAAVGEASEVVVLAVPGAPEVHATLDELLPALAPGELVVDTSTTGPEAAARAEERCRGADMEFLTAPLTRAAPAGGIHFMVGGDPATYEAATDLLGTLGREHTRIGDPRRAQSFKLCLQLRYAGHEAVDAEVVAAARALGADPEPYRDYLGMELAEGYFTGDFSQDIEGMGGLAIWRKDLGYLLDVAHEENVATPLAAAIHDAYKHASRVATEEEGNSSTLLRHWRRLNDEE
jgi:3-hydroxyisobutyrate dehydrogenase-like beta-hydroxyacid dehydrogenase